MKNNNVRHLTDMPENYRMVVFDDDPTGIQTVHGCLLLTEWSAASLKRAFGDREPFFYILTNTRAMTPDEARRTMQDAAEAVVRANEDYGYHLICVSRSDSCLRGHFPLETDVIRETLRRHGRKVWEKVPFVPAFIESGRVTVNGIHYMRQEGTLVPVAETEFANDNVFAYTHSDLRGYITEKGADPDGYLTPDAASYADLYAFCHTMAEAARKGQPDIVVRASSSLPRALSGIADKPFITPQELMSGGGTGCFVVGSHVKKTTEQLNRLLAADGVGGIELPVEDILNRPQRLMSDTTDTIRRMAAQGVTPVIYTSRTELRTDDAAERQALGKRVSDFLVETVRQLPCHPKYLVAKGGITSHDILTHGLNVGMARVMGQVINSVPCIMAEKDGSPLPYIIFPGNVGTKDSLKEIYDILG